MVIADATECLTLHFICTYVIRLFYLQTDEHYIYVFSSALAHSIWAVKQAPVTTDREGEGIAISYSLAEPQSWW